MPPQPVVLCIDDNATGLNTRKLLLEAKGYRVLTAEDGPAGLAIANSEQIDVVIIDFRLPRMDGGQVAKELRTMHPEIPILLLSGFSGDIPESVVQSVDKVVVKGGPPAMLLREVERLTGATATQGYRSAEALDASKKHIERSRALLGKAEEVLRRIRRTRM